MDVAEERKEGSLHLRMSMCRGTQIKSPFQSKGEVNYGIPQVSSA